MKIQLIAIFLLVTPFVSDYRVAVQAQMTREDLGPSSRAAVRVTAGNSCGSGAVVGENLVLTNAHVVGTRVGREVKLDAIVQGADTKVSGRVIMAAYSDRSQTDWAIVKTEGLESIRPAKLSKSKPTGKHYTKGSPRCKWPQVSSFITTVDVASNKPLWRWQPNAISGQSGSGVWSVETDFQEGLLTWSWGGYGAGQQTAEIYRQAKERSVDGLPRPEGLKEVTVRDKDTIVENGFYSNCTAADLDIWADGKLEDKAFELDVPFVANGFYAQTGIDGLPIWEGEDEETPEDEPPADDAEKPEPPFVDDRWKVILIGLLSFAMGLGFGFFGRSSFNDWMDARKKARAEAEKRRRDEFNAAVAEAVRMAQNPANKQPRAQP